MLEDEFIVSFDLYCENKIMTIVEGCDYYYTKDLNKKEVKQFIDELTSRHKEMKD